MQWKRLCLRRKRMVTKNAIEHLGMVSPLSSTVSCDWDGAVSGVSGASTHRRRCKYKLPRPCSSNLNQESLTVPKTLSLPLTNLTEY